MNDSENLKNEDQLLSMMEEMQDQIEGLQTDILAEQEKTLEAQKTISKLSSENSTLKNEIWKKSEIIVSQNEKIEKLSESDLVLKKNEELKKENARLQNHVKKTEEEAEAKVEVAKEQADKEVAKVKQDFKDREYVLSGREEGVGQRETLVTIKEHNIDTEIKNKALAMVEAEINVLASAASRERKELAEAYMIKTQKLQRKYAAMMAGYKGMVQFTLFYAIFTTVIMAIKTEVVRVDFMEFIHMIGNGIMAIFEWSKIAGLFVARLGDMIPNTTAALIIHWILLIIVCTAIIGGLGVSLVVLVKKYMSFYRKRQADAISVYVGLFVLAIIVFVADMIKSILSINLFMVALVIFVGYTIVRGVIQAENTEAKKKIMKYAGIAMGGVGTFAIIVYFFGAIGIIAIPIGMLIAEGEK